MAGNRVTLLQLQQQMQQQNAALQEQLQQQNAALQGQIQLRIEEIQGQMQARQEEVQNLTATINNMAQGFEATQAAINQLLANQVGQPAVAPAVPIPEPPIAVEVPVQNHNGNHYTLEKFIKNGAKVFTGTTDPEKAEAWTLNMLKSFRAMEVPEAHWVRLASCRLEDKAAFW